MPYSLFPKKCWGIHCLSGLLALVISIPAIAQVKWDGEAGDGQWSSAANWSGNMVPAVTDDVLLDNSMVPGNYTVTLPGTIVAVTIRSIALSPAAGNIIQFIVPVSSTAAPAFTATGPGYGITLNNGGVMMNASGATSGAAIAVSDSFRINNGGQYTHNTRSSHAGFVTVLSRQPGTEKGIFKFDVPGGGYTFASTGRVYGSLVFSAAASGGSQVYSSSAASPFTINGDCIINAGVTVNLDITAATTINGNYQQLGGVFNLASQPNNNTVYFKGDLLQTAGAITETSTGLPAIELNGHASQQVKLNGAITNSVGFRVNNSAGIALLSDLSLPYRLSLINGIVNEGGFLTTLQTGCSIAADSASNNSFINGALRKEGLLNAAGFLFPVGKDIVQRWIELKNASGNYTVEFLKGNPSVLSSIVGNGIHHTSSIEYWAVRADPAPAPVANIELSFNNVNSGGVTDMLTLRVAQLVSGVWTDGGNIASTGTPGASGSVVSNPINVFDAGNTFFTLASSNALQNPLPLKLISFTGIAGNNSTTLRWTIESTWQPLYFQLQSSADGIHFTGLPVMTRILKQDEYAYTDARQWGGTTYYRLKAMENDSTVFYSASITVKSKAAGLEPVQLLPSVVKGNASLWVYKAAAGNAQIKIYNMEGRAMMVKSFSLTAGNNQLVLVLQGLASGVYILTLTTADQNTSTCRFLKLE